MIWILRHVAEISPQLLYPLQTKFWGVYRNHLCVYPDKNCLGINFWIESDRAFTFHICIPCSEISVWVPKILVLWPWTPIFTYFRNNLRLSLTFELKEIGFSYYTWYSLWQDHSVHTKMIPWPWPPTFTYFWKKLNLGINFWTERDPARLHKFGWGY